MFLSLMIVHKKEELSKRCKLAIGLEVKQFKQRNVSLLVKFVKLYLDHWRLRKSQGSVKIVNFMLRTLPHTWSTKTSTKRACFHYPRAEELGSNV